MLGLEWLNVLTVASIIILSKCIKKYLKIMYIKQHIAYIDQRISSLVSMNRNYL